MTAVDDDAPRPVVGVTAYAEPAVFGVWRTTATLLPQSYVARISQAGGLPVLLPPLDAAAADAAELLDRLDALVLAGGADVDPRRYDATPHPRTDTPRRARDAAESALAAGALERGLPLLGICRGMQVLNVLRGGTLHQHLPDVVGHTGHRVAPGRFGRHPVRVAPTSRLAAMLGRCEVTVPTYHHQAVDRLGAGLVPVAWARDGVVEAVEVEGVASALAVQWHPEEDDDDSLFTWLIGAARTVAVGRRAVASDRRDR